MSNAWVICLQVWDNPGKPELIPDETTMTSVDEGKDGLSLEAIAWR